MYSQTSIGTNLIYLILEEKRLLSSGTILDFEGNHEKSYEIKLEL